LCWNFLGKQTCPEKCLSLQGCSNKFSLRNATKNFWMSGWNPHVHLLPDSCVSPVIVCMPDFSMFFENIAPTFLGNFYWKIWKLKIVFRILYFS
jgi:hypothetical protein